jgi:hypothetical protein
MVLYGRVDLSLLSLQRPSDMVHSASLGGLVRLCLAKGLFLFFDALMGYTSPSSRRLTRYTLDGS